MGALGAKRGRSLSTEALIGQRFGKWLATGPIERPGAQWRIWCQCDCGARKLLIPLTLTAGSSTRCRRCVPPTHLVHGDSRRGKKTSEYAIWASMIQRCVTPTCKAYSYYGGRGITVCGRWAIFENFLADMGRRPGLGYSIDRIDNDGNYEPSNCRWATAKEQRANQRPRTRWPDRDTETGRWL